MKELESLQNAVISVNLEGLKIRQVYSEDNRKKTNRFTLDLNGLVISPVLNYDKMNHFILGFSKAKQLSINIVNDRNTSKVREENKMLLDALKGLLIACEDADKHEDLSDFIDGSLLDNAQKAINTVTS